MSTNLVTLNGKAVATEAPDKNVINIHITQESSLTYLFRALGQRSAKQEKAAQKTSASSDSSSSRGCYKGEQKVLGSVQVLLGLLCITLGLLNWVQEPVVYGIIEGGAPFWMGGLFIFSGAWSIAGERRGGLWLHMATFFNLASVVSGIVALTCGIAASAAYYSYSDICEDRRDAPWGIVATVAPEEDWRVSECKDHVQKLVSVVWGIRILLLIFSIAALGIALFSFGYGLWVLCQSLKANLAYTALGDAEVPPPYEDQPRAEQSDACPVV